MSRQRSFIKKAFKRHPRLILRDEPTVRSKNACHGTLGRADSGQSVLEFLLVLPLLLAIAALMIRVNTAIQISIVDQKYAREQMLFVAGNGADYPRRAGIIKQFSEAGDNRLIIGVSDNHPADDEGASVNPIASTFYIARKKGQGSENTQDDSILQRGTVRIRNTVTLCLPQVSFGGKPYKSDPTNGGTSQYNLPEDPRSWDFCSSKQEQII